MKSAALYLTADAVGTETERSRKRNDPDNVQIRCCYGIVYVLTVTADGREDVRMRFLKSVLIDDHGSGPPTDNLIGYIVSPGSVPQIVACYPEAPYRKRAGGWFCLNEVYRDAEHHGHVSRTSVITISGERTSHASATSWVRLRRAT